VAEQDPERRWVLFALRDSRATRWQLGAGAERRWKRSSRCSGGGWRRWTMITAAAAAIVIMAVVLIGRPQEFATKTAGGTWRRWRMARAWSSTRARWLTVDFGKAERRVRLAHGGGAVQRGEGSGAALVVETPAGAVARDRHGVQRAHGRRRSASK